MLIYIYIYISFSHPHLEVLIHVHVDLWDLTMYVNTNLTHLLNELGFLNPNNDIFIKRVNCVNPLIRFYQSKQKQKKNTNFSINPIDFNYEKPNK